MRGICDRLKRVDNLGAFRSLALDRDLTSEMNVMGWVLLRRVVYAEARCVLDLKAVIFGIGLDV